MTYVSLDIAWIGFLLIMNTVAFDSPSKFFRGKTEYQQMLDALNLLSLNQTDVIADTFTLPFVTHNPGMAPWVYSEQQFSMRVKTDHPKVLIIWRPESYSLAYIVMSTGPLQKDWQVVWGPHHLLRKLSVPIKGKTKDRFYMPADPRLVTTLDNKNVRMFYCANWITRGFSFAYSDLLHDPLVSNASLFVESPFYHLDIQESHAKTQQKNWQPFSVAGKYFYIFSINPHRIVHAPLPNGTELHHRFGWDVLTVPVETLFLTGDSLDLWDFGEPRGGTPPIIINTPFGPRFITFFHSSGWFLAQKIKTYFMGAYLFNPKPPFQITHFSRVPLVPRNYYSGPVASRFIDFVIFPTGAFLVDHQRVAISLGRNDKEGVLVIIKLCDQFFKNHLRVVNNTANQV